MSVRTNLTIIEESRSWYCVRLWGSDAKRQRAMTSAFYFGTSAPPPPVQANVHARLLDAGSGALLRGTLVEVTYAGTLARPGKRRQLRTGDGQLIVPATVRLRAEVAGYEPVELSPVFDSPATVRMITSLTDTDLLDWTTFERMRRQLATVNLEFKLRKLP